ncbi:MAG: hypothetical protein ACR2L9_11095 [Solirubrobacteraceae bacterium]
MSRASVLLAALTSEPVSTSELYTRVGYATLAQMGLVPYQAFRAELAKLSSAGLAESDIGRDGSTVWRLADDSEPGSG